jgi:hypothetical protein
MLFLDLVRHLYSALFVLVLLFFVTLVGLVVSMLATGPKVGFRPSRGGWILRVIKSIARLPLEGK